MASNAAAVAKVETLLLHLSSDDPAKRRVALGVLDGLFRQKNHPQPPPQIIRTLLHCLCLPDSENATISILELIFQIWPSLGSNFITENMGLAVLWLFVATYPVEDVSKRADTILSQIEESNIMVVESDVTSAFIEILKDSGRKWVEDGVNVLALQILTITSPKLSPAAQKIIEKEIYTVPILVYFLSFLNNPQALTPESIVHSKLLDVVRDNGIPLMIQTFMKNPDPDAKSSALQGLRSFSNVTTDFEIPFFDEVVKCITSSNRILQQEALNIANDYIPESCKNIEFEQHVKALETGGEDAASYMEFLTRNERQAGRFAKNAYCVEVLTRATEEALVRKVPDYETSFLPLMHNIAGAASDAGSRALRIAGVEPILLQIVSNPAQHFINRAHALEVLDLLGEDLEQIFNKYPEFVDACREKWPNWVNELPDLPARYSVTFVKDSSDAEALYKIVSGKSAYQAVSRNIFILSYMNAIKVIVNTLANLFARPPFPDSKPAALKQLSLLTSHELVPGVVHHLMTLQLDDKSAANTKLTLYSLLSLANDVVRQHVVDERNVPILLSLLQNTAVASLHSENITKALVLVAFCCAGEFVRHGGVDAFVKLLKQQKHMSLIIVGLWAVAIDPEYHSFMSNVSEALKPYVNNPEYSKHAAIFDYAPQVLSLLKNSKDVKIQKSSKSKKKGKVSEKLSSIDQYNTKYQSIENKLVAFCSHVVTSIAKLNENNFTAVLQLCSEVKLMVQFIHYNSVEHFPEIKQIIDFYWMCFNFHHLEISIVSLYSFLFLYDHWTMLDSKSPNKYTKTLLLGIPQFESDFDDEIFKKGIAEVLLRINKISTETKVTANGDQENRQMEVLNLRLDKQQEAFSQATTKLAELNQAIQAHGEANSKLREDITLLQEKNSSLESKAKQLYELHNAKDAVIEQIKEKCLELEQLRDAQPSDERLVEYFRNSTIDPLHLLHINHLDSLNDIKSLKDRLMDQIKKLKERKSAIMLGKQETYEETIKNKEQQIEKYREILMCPICMDKTKDTVFVPCGHAFCAKCSSAILNANSGRCPICRINIDSHHLFYF